MPLDPGVVIWLLLLGGWVAVDATSFGQFMVSRPIVAAPLAGWVVGDPLAGAMLGVLLEAFHLGVLPVGAARYPEGGPAAVVAGAAFAAGSHSGSALVTSMAFALVWGWLGGESVRYLRQLNVRILSMGTLDRVERLEQRHFAALLVDFLRGTILVAIGWPMLNGLLAISESVWGMGERIPHVILFAVLSGLIASSVRLLGGRVAWFGAGLLGGVLFMLLR